MGCQSLSMRLVKTLPRERALTQVVYNERLAPLGAMGARLLGALADGPVEQNVIDLVLPEFLERLFGEGLDVAQVVELEW